MAYKVFYGSGAQTAPAAFSTSTHTHQAREIFARVVILCAQSQESVRILLNSATPQVFPWSCQFERVLGHYLHRARPQRGGSGEFPAFAQAFLGGPQKPLGI